MSQRASQRPRAAPSRPDLPLDAPARAPRPAQRPRPRKPPTPSQPSQTPASQPRRSRAQAPSASERRTRNRSPGPVATPGSEDEGDDGRGAVDWDNDAHDNVPSSISLLCDWLGTEHNWSRFKHGYEGHKQLSASVLCEKWMAEKRGSRERKAEAIQRKINRLFNKWKKVRDWRAGTGNGKGQYLIDHALPHERAEVIRYVEEHCLAMMPEFDVLDPIFSGKDGGSESQRGDSSQAVNPALNLFANPSPSPSPPPLEIENDSLEGYQNGSAGPTPSQSRRSPSSQTIRHVLDLEHADQEQDLAEAQRRMGIDNEPARGRMEERSVTDRQHGQQGDRRKRKRGLHEDAFSEASQDFERGEEEWRSKKEGYMMRDEAVRQQELSLRRREVKEKEKKGIREAADRLMGRDPSLTLAQAIRQVKAAERELADVGEEEEDDDLYA